MKYKHKWDGLKKNWVLWNKLKGSETGLGWDAAKGTIAATEWWERKLTNGMFCITYCMYVVLVDKPC